MRKTLIALLLTLLILVALPTGVRAASENISREQAVRAELSRIYSKCLESAQVETFSGYCGLMTCYQLLHLGINSVLGPTYDGNMHYEAYANSSVTSGGYSITAYPGDQYTLDQALSAITRGGTQIAENVLVGFETTTTEAGALYGHALLIHTIMDGKVYYIESYDSTVYGPAGTVIVQSVSDFVASYSAWTVLDGVIHFGNRRFANSCQTFATDIFVRTRFDSTLRSEPCLLTENDCTRLRSLIPGELLHATAVYMNSRGERYYCISDGDRTGFVAANAVSVVQISDEALHADAVTLPAVVALKEPIAISGKVMADNGSISAARLAITDSSDRSVLEARMDVVGSVGDLSQLNDQLSLDSLEAGTYTVTVYATAACVCVRGNGLVTQYEETAVHTQPLTVGQMAVSGAAVERPAATNNPDGWFLRGGTWYCYRFQKPCIGWVTHLGVEYYLQKDGSVTTGLAEVEGWERYFSATGALCRGWVSTPEGIRYWLPDGICATGWHTLEGKLYCFNEEGYLITNATLEKDGIAYKLGSDGSAVEKK